MTFRQTATQRLTARLIKNRIKSPRRQVNSEALHPPFSIAYSCCGTRRWQDFTAEAMAKVPAVSSLLFAALADSGCTKQRKNGKTIFRFHPLNDDPRVDGEVVAIRPRTNRQKPGISKIKLSIQSRACKNKTDQRIHRKRRGRHIIPKEVYRSWQRSFSASNQVSSGSRQKDKTH